MIYEEPETIHHILIAVPLIAIPLGFGYIWYRIRKMRKKK